MATLDELASMIKDMAISETFQKSAIDSIAAQKSLMVELQKKNDALADRLNETTATLADAISKLSAMDSRESKMAEREQAVAKREVAITDLEKRAAVNEAVANTVKECFGLVFRNATISKSVTSSTTGSETANGGSYNTSSKYGSETVTEKVTQE